MSVDIGGYWGGWEGGVVAEPGWSGGGEFTGSVDIGGYWGGWEGGVVAEPGWAGGGYGPTSDVGAGTSDWGPGPVHGIGEDRWQQQQQECPAGYRRDIVCAAIYRIDCLPDRPGCCRCAELVEEPTEPPPGECPAGYRRDIVCTADMRIECLPEDPTCCRCGERLDGQQPEDPLNKMADVIVRMIGGGGGGIVIPQVPQPQVVAAPVTRQQMNPVALLLVIGGLAIGGYYVYQVTRRRA